MSLSFPMPVVNAPHGKAYGVRAWEIMVRMALAHVEFIIQRRPDELSKSLTTANYVIRRAKRRGFNADSCAYCRGEAVRLFNMARALGAK
jgi:hypothetical protein